MRMKYIGKSQKYYLLNSKIYEVLSIEKGWYRVIDETGEDYLYPPELFASTESEDSIDIGAFELILRMLK